MNNNPYSIKKKILATARCAFSPEIYDNNASHMTVTEKLVAFFIYIPEVVR